MKPHEELLEFRRKTLHLLIGVTIAALLWLRILDAVILLSLAFFLLGFFLFLRELHYKIPFLFTLLRLFEREKHIRTFPGKSAINFLFACALTAALFPRDIAVASIIILAFGDAISNIIGHHLGRTTTPLHPIKKIEGPIVAVCIASYVAGFFVPFHYALLAASVAMILEFPEWVFFGVHIDDNLIIPLSSGFILLLLMW